MNRSGAAVRCLVERHEIPPERLLVVYDDVALPLGRMRLRPGGGPGGHRGMESIVEALGTAAVPRLRLGVGPVPDGLPEDGLAAFVLAPFAADERPAAEAMLARAAESVRIWAAAGLDAAMNRTNAPELPGIEPPP
jgi:PTH1 family peptidyl-tRNA hydrolase